MASGMSAENYCNAKLTSRVCGMSSFFENLLFLFVAHKQFRSYRTQDTITCILIQY